MLNPEPLTVLDTDRVVKAPVEAVVAPIADPSIVPPVMATALEFWVAIDPIPKFVLAADAVDAPVPPDAIGRGADKIKDAAVSTVKDPAAGTAFPIGLPSIVL